MLRPCSREKTGLRSLQTSKHQKITPNERNLTALTVVLVEAHEQEFVLLVVAQAHA